MRLLFNIKDIEFTDELNDFWWQEKDYLLVVLQCLEQAGLLKDINYFNHNDQLKQVKNLNDIQEKINNIKKNRAVFSLQPNENRDQSNIDFSLGTDFFGLQTIIYDEFLIKDKTIINKLIGLFLAIYESLKRVAVFGPNINIWLADFQYPKIKPPRNMKSIGNTDIVNIIHQKCFIKYPQLMFEGFERLFTEKLPEGASREKIDDLYIIKWCESIDNKNLKEMFMQREAWLYKTFSFPVDSRFNEKR